MRGHQRHRPRRVPPVHQHRRGAQQQRAFKRVDRAADMGERRRHQECVAGIDRPVVTDLADQRMYRIMGVQNTFRAAGGAGGIEDHPHRIGIQGRKTPGRSAQHAAVRGVPTGSPRCGAAQHHHLRRRTHRGRHAVQHRRVVVAAVPVRDENHCSAGILEDETQVVVAQRRQDRVHHHAGQCRGQVDDRGLVPVRQHERHHAAGRDTGQQGGGQLAGLGVQGGAVQPNLVVHQRYPLGRTLRSGARRVGQCATHPPAAPVGQRCLRGVRGGAGGHLNRPDR